MRYMHTYGHFYDDVMKAAEVGAIAGRELYCKTAVMDAGCLPGAIFKRYNAGRTIDRMMKMGV